MPAAFPNEELVACAKRETAMRRSVYCKREGKTSIEECSPGLQKEHAMMQAITEQLIALPELLARYQAAKNELALAYKGAEEFNDELQKYKAAYGPLTT